MGYEPVRDPAGSSEGQESFSPSPQPVIAGFDGSQSSEHALAYAAGLARRLGTRLVVVYVRSTGTVMPTGFGALDVLPDDIADSDLINQVGEVLSCCVVQWELLERMGSPDRELLAVADELRADAVVVGRSASRLHRLVGSVAGRIVRRCDQPVVVVP